MTDIALSAGDQLTPSFDHAEVADAMRHGVIACNADTPLRAVARAMATHHVHCVVVTGREVDPRGRIGTRPWGIVTDLDLVRNAADADDITAAGAAGELVGTVTPDTSLADAARRMHAERTAHFVVVDQRSGAPIGVLSALDIAGNLAWARG